MRFSTVLALAFAGLAAAQTTTTSAAASSTSCAAENIVDACLEGYQSREAGCAGTDYECLCAVYTDEATCFNNCPGDPRAAPKENQVTQFCNAAKANPSSTTSATATATATDSSAATTSASSSSTSSTSAAGSAFNQAGSSTTSSKGAAATAGPAAGALAMVLGAAALL